ncbi:hypothetical protein GTY83_07185 [Streptomyces sp. SID4928]|uniref:hypothetical protein n=1 Tax=unclassified Streptomyces TaxID=2593676 RepID=UPI0001C1C989|nr:hypothetical protein [Streptomyces sp. ACT-1]EGE40819.1 hypothetical protein SACT1_1454 [Streptomyces sp. ACT-1]MYR48889.1 hypothetical protein [Streptomyces sp. SID4928]
MSVTENKSSVLPSPAPVLSAPVPPQPPAPTSRADAGATLWAFAAEHGISLRLNSTPGTESMLQFSRNKRGGFVLEASPDHSLAEVLAFARTVVERHRVSRRVYAVARALEQAANEKNGFAELAEAFLHATAWRQDAAGEFLGVIEEALTGVQSSAGA